MTYDDLPDTIGTRQPQPQMVCTNVDCEHFLVLYSAERGDYFMLPRNAEIACVCGTPMVLAVERRTIELLP